MCKKTSAIHILPVTGEHLEKYVAIKATVPTITEDFKGTLLLQSLIQWSTLNSTAVFYLTDPRSFN